MIDIYVTDADGAERIYSFAPGQTLMRAATDAGIEGIKADCGGMLTCAMCHVYVYPAWTTKLPDPGEDELCLLDMTAEERQPNSRLSCQIRLTENLDGLHVKLPKTQISPIRSQTSESPMPRFFSFLSLRSSSREQALRDFVAGGIIEKCRDVVPGFVGAALLSSLHDHEAAAVLVEWKDEQAYLDWQRSPARESLRGAERFEAPGPSQLFTVAHEVHATPAAVAESSLRTRTGNDCSC